VGGGGGRGVASLGARGPRDGNINMLKKKNLFSALNKL